jgi:ketosteroid isomerase-like protein
MSKILTPEELLNSQIEEFNRGNISFLMTLYEKDACFAFKAGQVVMDKEGIRQILQDLIDTGGKLKAKVKRVLNVSNLALLITEWSITNTGIDDKPINLSGRGTIVLRRQSNGTWLMVIENPCGTD